MGRYWFDVALIAVLMLVNGVVAGSEMALISLREGQLRALERRGTRRDHSLVRLARDPNRYLGDHPTRHHTGRLSRVGHRRGDSRPARSVIAQLS